MTLDANPPAFTALASWTRAIRKGLLAARIDADALLAEAGIALSSLSDPQARLPVAQTTRLWKLAVAATGDPAFGLSVAGHVEPTMFHALGYAMAVSATLAEAFARAERYSRIVSDAGELMLEPHGDERHVLIRTVTGEAAPADEAIDAFVALQARAARSLTAGRVVPLRVQLRRVAPTAAQAYERVFRAPVQFGAEDNRLVFAAADFAQPLEGANPELARLNESMAAQQLARIGSADLPARVRAALSSRLPDGEPTAAEVAATLHLSLRSLQRKLAERGLSFETLLDDTRRALAEAHLRERKLSVGEVAFLLGFADASSFTRAFRRWTGNAPSAWREEQTTGS